MSSHQDYLARRRLAATLMNPSANMPTVLEARSYTEVKAFVLETACAANSVPTQLRQSLITAESAAHTSSTGVVAADPRKYDLRGLPIALVENCPPAYPMLIGTTDMLEDGTTPARGNRAPATNYARVDHYTDSLAASSVPHRWVNDAYSAYSRVPKRLRQRECDIVCRAAAAEEEVAVPPVAVSARLWLDASDASTLFQDTNGQTQVTASGQYVRLWRDKSSSALAFEEQSANNHHMWSGGMVICSGAAGAGLRLTASSNGDALPLAGESSSVFLVLRQTNEFTTTQTAVPFVYGSGVAPRMWFVANNNARIGAVNVDLIHSSTPLLGTATRIISCTQPAVGVAAWIDGQAFTSGENTTYNWETAGVSDQMDAWLFNMTINAQENPFQGAIAELMVLDGLLSDADRQAVEGHLAWKWGTQSALPVGHPYRTVQPPEVTISSHP